MKSLLVCQRVCAAPQGFLFASRVPALPIASRRHQSSYRRTKSRLNIKPDASFLPSTTEPHDHIIYNPPPSAPNIYHTPRMFLPASDRRKQLQHAVQLRNLRLGNLSGDSSEEPLAPITGRVPEKKYHLTEKDFDEMRRLRREDPAKWNVTALSKKFDCVKTVVMYATAYIANQQRENQKRVTEYVRSRWGVKRRVAREDRALRKERWFTDS
jgi:hypothetical protein